MDGDKLFEGFRREILGRKVTFIRLVLDQLLIHVDSEPGDDWGHIFWFASAWKVAASGGELLTDSHQAWRIGEDGPEEDDMDRVCGLIADALFGREVTEVRVDESTRDLTVIVENSHLIQTNLSEASDDPRASRLSHGPNHPVRLGGNAGSSPARGSNDGPPPWTTCPASAA